jgi:death-on-curing protein
LLESALARPLHQWTYKRRVGLARLAAAYAHGLLRNHPFHDGNKRVAFLTMVVFLGLNGYDFIAEDAEVVAVIRAAAAGESAEDDLARWIRDRMARQR